MIESYPLYWPEGWPRAKKRKRSAFQTTFGLARDCMLEEVRRLGGRDPIISTNVPLRRDGMPYATARAPDDPGVALYFTYKGASMCFACDQYDLVKDNLQAIRKTIEALRGIERWGASDMMERAFRGFAAINAPGSDPWWVVLECSAAETNIGKVRANYRRLVKLHHPDAGGDPEQFIKIKSAWDQANKEFQESR